MDLFADGSGACDGIEVPGADVEAECRLALLPGWTTAADGRCSASVTAAAMASAGVCAADAAGCDTAAAAEAAGGTLV